MKTVNMDEPAIISASPDRYLISNFISINNNSITYAFYQSENIVIEVALRRNCPQGRLPDPLMKYMEEFCARKQEMSKAIIYCK